MAINSDTVVLKISNYKSKIYFILKLLIAVSLLVYLVALVDLKNIISSFANADIYLLVLSASLLIPNIYVQYLKWKLTFNNLIGETNRKRILLSLFYGFPAAVFTPGRAGEYFGRGLAFKDYHLSEIIIATLVDKFFTILVTFITGSVGMIVFINSYYSIGEYIPLPLLIAFLFLTLLTVAFIFSDKEWFYKIISPVFRIKLFSRFGERLLILKNLDRKYVFKMIFISTIFFMCYLIQFTILFTAFSHHFNYLNFFLAALVIMFAKTILSPISLSELGVREGASIYFLTQLGESSTTALNASIVLFGINILFPSIVGMILLFVKNND